MKEIGFDYEEMARLANEDPDGFARRREELIQRLIERRATSNQSAFLPTVNGVGFPYKSGGGELGAQRSGSEFGC